MMKKFMSALLAAAMTVSMASVALAKEEIHQGVVAVDPTALRYDKDGTPPLIPFAKTMGSMTLGYGEVAYFALLANDDLDAEGDDTDHRLVTNSEMVDGLKVKVEYEQGEELVSGVSIVKMKVEDMRYSPFAGHNPNKGSEAIKLYRGTDPANPTDPEGYYYFIAMQTIPRATTSDADIVGTMTLNKSKKGEDKGKNYKLKDLEVDFTVNVFYPYNYNAFDLGNEYGITDLLVAGQTGIGEKLPLKPGDHYLLKYDYDDEAEFSFGLEPNEGTFTVDVSGQGKNLISYNTVPDEALCAANPGASLVFLNFNGAKFNRTGEFVYEADEMSFAYQLAADGSLKSLGEFEGGEVAFKTKTLGRYIFSDVEIVAAPKPAEVAPAAETVPASVIVPAQTVPAK